MFTSWGVQGALGDYVFAAGGTAGIDDRIESVREVVGDKPVKYGMLTHHHFDHVVVAPVYEGEGAAVVTATAHERIARRAARTHRTLNGTDRRAK